MQLAGQGGTLEPGPGCPSLCGSFVACEPNLRSQAEANRVRTSFTPENVGIVRFCEGMRSDEAEVFFSFEMDGGS